ncbi:uncharacterized protein LOC114945855 [Nylanderia fulva]|uniref:uncharacterized protein LOC114945855 n=1 Tax=Nylanderia fulva TaxID=613905 RepID=UPI0010FBBA0E|nr:uncharacterized protein LOC114945855 [Nylanderia fulva]
MSASLREIPFDVFIQSSQTQVSIDPLAIGRIISPLYRNDIIEIKKSGFSRIVIQFKSRTTANSILSNSVLKSKNYVFTSSSRISRRGIIRNVPLDMSDEEILQSIDSAIPIISVKRFNRRLRRPEHSSPGKTSSRGTDNESSLIPSRTISLTFKGQKLPLSIFLYRIRYAVNPFVTKTALCFSCFRFDHLKSQCKGHPRCILYKGGVHESDSSCPKEKDPPSCINCKGAHRATSLQCPTYVSQKRVSYFKEYFFI